jgi:NAD(P)-dependent dehydrogenase (short-subunit alcohol dehydrogenase family)
VTTAFVPLLKKSDHPVILNVSSGLGSTTRQADPTSSFFAWQIAGYNSSKAALNHYTVTVANDFKEARVYDTASHE